jgi:formylglycine-generating enzyme required for sulfatase activity
MTEPTVGMTVSGGHIQGIAGAGTVLIENYNIYNRAAEEPAIPAPAAADTEPIPPCPYPGLAYFGPDDADRFFGRDAAIARLAGAIGRQSFTALVGASGSGKSSVVLAGLAPRLHGDRDGNWRFSHFRIGTELESNPFLALARAVGPLYVTSQSDVERLRNSKLLAASLAAGELTLRDVFADCRSRNKGRRILLIADQFEEAFTLIGDDAMRNRFIDVLLAGFPDPAIGTVPDICLILTMRADFYGSALRHRPLADALQNHVENLGPMNREELQTAVVNPAQRAGVAFEPGMVETLLDAVQSTRGGLPLLQFALREMWGRQQRKTITRKSYDEIGGVEGALAQRAGTIYDALTANGKDMHAAMLFRRLFMRLVTFGEGAEDTRRVVGRAELTQEEWSLVQRLANEDNRLIVTGALGPGRETAEVVHEALIRNWPNLVEWVNHDREFQSWRQQLRPRVDEWRNSPADEGTPLRGGPLVVAEDWLARRPDEFSEEERTFVAASLKLRDTEREREKGAQARERRTARLQLSLFAVVGCVVVGLFGWLEQYWLLERWNWFMVVRPYMMAQVRPHVLTAEHERALKRMDSFRECAKDCPEMIVVPPGEFVMGWPGAETSRGFVIGPQHQVTIAKPFAVGKFDVSSDEWAACVKIGGCSQISYVGMGNRPVIYVSWNDAQQYVAWLSKMTGQHYRLLSEAEWEYAARAGGDTSPVDSFKPNAYGLHDMVGNVLQWVEDCSHDNYNGAPTDGSAWTAGDCSIRHLRGATSIDIPRQAGAANRNRNSPGLRAVDVGFRVGRTLTR